MGKRKTSLEIDEKLLAGAKQALGTTTIKETVERAFLEVLRVEARREEVRALITMKGMDLADPEIMAGAWRG